ncbi:MAG: hypothetical protein NTW04_05390, partial [Elusimicrobia bacterium]|nr:hypothetical protein [Elusimicrobiota bacterium]
MNFDFRAKILDRFYRYIKVDTQSDPNSKTIPSTKGQLVLAKMIAKEMKEIGVKNVFIDKFGYLYGEIPSNTPKKVPAIGFIAHFDTAVETSGKNVIAQMHKNYRGGDIIISKEKNVILSPKDSPEISKYTAAPPAAERCFSIISFKVPQNTFTSARLQRPADIFESLSTH